MDVRKVMCMPGARYLLQHLQEYCRTYCITGIGVPRGAVKQAGKPPDFTCQ